MTIQQSKVNKRKHAVSERLSITMENSIKRCCICLSSGMYKGGPRLLQLEPNLIRLCLPVYAIIIWLWGTGDNLGHFPSACFITHYLFQLKVNLFYEYDKMVNRF